MIQLWDVTQINLKTTRETQYEVAVMPASAIEPHGFHLPYGLDFIHATHIARRCCSEAWAAGAKVLCLPGMPYGVDCNLADFPLALHVSQSTIDLLLREIVLSLRRDGIRKFVIINGHGGNDFVPFVRQIQGDVDSHVFLCNWWLAVQDQYREHFEYPDDHGGEMETSVALALCPELVRMEQAGEGAVRPFQFEALRKGWVKTSRRFASMNDESAVGHPRRATAEKGRKYLDIVCGRITEFLKELAAAPIGEHFPHSGEPQIMKFE